MSVRSIGATVLWTAGLFVAGVAIFNFVIMPLYIKQRGTVIVPDLTRVSEAQAEKRLNELGLNFRVLRSNHHAEIPAGAVVSQDPKANESIKQGRTVEVVLSDGARMERVPDLRGMSLRQARNKLEGDHLTLGRVARVFTTASVRERVLTSTPDAGTELIEGSVVDIVVAVGGKAREFVMPELTGQDLLFIREKLRNQGFRIGGVRYEKRDGIYPNTVIGQEPTAGSMIREGDAIELVAASAE